MIANITKGRKAVGALVYDFGPGRRDEHINPRIVAGNVTGTPLQVARAIDHTARQRPEITAPIWRASLSLPDEDGILPDAQWADIANKFIAEMGFASAPWVAVRHGDDHIHLTVSRVDWSGQLLTDRWDYRRAREAADVLEEEHGLVRARDRFRDEGPQVRNNELEASNRRRGPEPAAPPEREELRRIVREVRDASRGLGRDAFESGLTDAGVSFRANVASTGRMNGYSFTLDGLVDGAGEQVWFPASKVAKDLRWAALGPVLGDPPEGAPVRQVVGRAASTSLIEDQAEADVAEFARQAAKILRDGQAERGIVAADHPALSTDPAQRLLEQWRMKQSGETVPVERLAPAESVPAWDDKRRRPYGALGAEKLMAAVKKAEREAERSAHSRDAAQRAARSWDGLATGAVTGDHVQALHKLNARLAEAEPHLKVVREQMELAKRADGVADAARKIWREANARKDLGRVDLWKLKTSKKEETKKADTAGEAIHLYVDQGAQARRTASKAHEEAVKASGLNDPAAEQERVSGQWPELLRTAQERDQSQGVARREAALIDAATYERRRTAELAKAAKLRQEQTLRTSMPEAQRKAEARARSAAARPKDGKKVKKAGTGRRYTGPRPDERPPHLRQPPPPPNRGQGHGL